MELRDQDKEKARMPSSLSYNTLPTKEPPSKISSASLSSSVARGVDREGDRDESALLSTTFAAPQTLVHNHIQQDQFHLQHHQHPQRRYQDPDPDPSLNPSSHPVTTDTSPIRYRECLKNHAASMGGHVVDGCGEFMPGGMEGTPEALKCAACDCHRNFHRKEVSGEPQHNSNYYYAQSNPNKNNTNNRRNDSIPPPLPPSHPHHQIHPYPLPLPPRHQHQGYSHARPPQPTMMAFGGGPAESSSDDLNAYQEVHQQSLQHSHPPAKKRFRTKFTAGQKDKMMELAENLGWKIQKQNEEQVKQFCAEVGIKKQVFKVWMHNNKQAMKKKQP